MATERIVIENYKGIKKLDLEVRPFTVLIGPQSVGKSTTAKLLYFFKNIAHEAIHEAMADNDRSLESHLIERFWKFMPPPISKGGKAVIRYSIGENVVSLTNKGDGDSNWVMELPKFLLDEFASTRSVLSNRPKNAVGDFLSLVRESRDRFGDRLQKYFSSEFYFKPCFIPSGRSFYAHLEKDPAWFFENSSLDPFFTEFGKELSWLKNSVSRSPLSMYEIGNHLKTVPRAAELKQQLLSGTYQSEGSKDFIITGDGQRIPDALWSSGQQESFPLVFFLYLICEGRMDNLSLFVEEPEAHLFPSSQRKIVELLALAFNAKPGKLHLFITTHSPYLLSTLNVLLRAGQLVGDKLSGELVDPLEALAPDSVGAYYMDQNECCSIIDKETGLIDGSGIDNVSGEIAEQFDALNSLQ